MWRLLLYLAVVAPHVFALFEDQLGNVDWHRRGIGAPLQASLHPRKLRLVTATDSRVLTHLHLRDGAVQWRQKLDSALIALHAPHLDNSVVTLAAEGRLLQCWTLDGTLKWQHLWTDPILALHFEDGHLPKLLYLRNGQLERRNGVDGVEWNAKVDALRGCDGVHRFSDGGAQMTLISLCKSLNGIHYGIK